MKNEFKYIFIDLDVTLIRKDLFVIKIPKTTRQVDEIQVQEV